MQHPITKQKKIAVLFRIKTSDLEILNFLIKNGFAENRTDALEIILQEKREDLVANGKIESM